MKPRLRGTVLALGAMLFASVGHAADHLDGTTTAGGALADPASDITDLYSWMSADGSQVYFILNVFPVAQAGSKFSNAVQYVIHTNSQANYVLATPGTSKEDIICTFDVNQKISCWLGQDDYASGDASATGGLASVAGHFKVFAGLRDDPFFFNLDGFKHLSNTVHGAASSLTFDTAGCPAINPSTEAELVYELEHGTDSAFTCSSSGTACPAPVDHFANFNVLSIVVAVDKALVTKGGPIMGVWASTHKSP